MNIWVGVTGQVRLIEANAPQVRKSQKVARVLSNDRDLAWPTPCVHFMQKYFLRGEMPT